MDFFEWLADTLFSYFYVKNCDFILVGFGSRANKIIKEAKKKYKNNLFFE